MFVYGKIYFGSTMEHYIIFEADIGQNEALALEKALKNAKKEGATHITILFSSSGGAIYYGFALATIIRNFEIPIRIHAANDISSIANIIYLSAKERTAESYAKFFLHSASTSGRFDIQGLKEQISSLSVQNSRIAHYLSETAEISLEKVKKLMDERRSMSAEEALTYKIVQEVKQEQIPVNASREDVIFL